MGEDRATLQTLAGADAPFLKPPHETLYPCLFEGTAMREDVAERLMGHILPVLESAYPGAREWTRFAVVGSGLSYNWDEAGDLDVQVWIDVDRYAAGGGPDPEHLVKGLRRAAGPVNYPRLADLGLSTDDCTGAMKVQFYVKAGTGTEREILDERPYAAYDLEAGRWIVEPEPLTPEFYAKLFLAVEKRAEALAEQADDLMDDLERRLAEAAYWDGLLRQSAGAEYEAQRDEARLAAEQAQAGVVQIFDTVFEGREAAYSPEGAGIRDERDATQKLLEVWGIFGKLKHHAREPLPWEPPGN